MNQYRTTDEMNDKTLMLKNQELRDRVAANGGELDYNRGFNIRPGYLSITLPDGVNPQSLLAEFTWVALVAENTVQTSSIVEETPLEQ